MLRTQEIVNPHRFQVLRDARKVPVIKGLWLLEGMLILTMGLLPVYMFPSGGPQLVDGPLLILLTVHFLWRRGAPPGLRKNITLLLPFIIWAALVNLGYFLLHTSDYLPLLKSAELFYTFLIFLAFSCLFHNVVKAKKIGLLYSGIFLSIILIFTVKGDSDEVIRSALSFNNPNQLGYYALFLACLAGLLMHWKEKEGGGKVIYFWCDFLIFSLAHLLMLLSLSRGALAAILLIDLWILPRLTKKITIFFLPLLTLSLISGAWQPEIIQEKLAGRPGKSMEAGEVTQDLSQRVIHQLSIMEGFHYLIGRGGVSLTWKDKADNIGEVHNIFGEVFRCYGLIGLGLFCVWLILMVWRSRVVPGGLYIWAALILYNMSHYGLRFRSFWILLALLNAMIYLESRRNNKNMEFVANARRRAIEEEMIKKRKLWALTRSSPPAAKV